MNPDLLWRYAPSLISGFGVTILCWGLGGALGLLIGFAITLMNRLRIPPLSWALRAFIEIFRGTPILIQLYIANYVVVGWLNDRNINPDTFWVGSMALGVNYGAYLTEVFRTGIESVSPGRAIRILRQTSRVRSR